MAAASRARILYIPHGGGPLPLLGDEGHQELVGFLRSFATTTARPKAIVVVSAHWEASLSTLTSAALPALVYDYFGFPDEAYGLRYPVRGNPELAERLGSALEQAGLPVALDKDRGFDHGVFVPLSLMYPEADIPCVQLSLVRGLDPALHLRIGQALAGLDGEGILILGSGFSFHNMQEFFSSSSSAGLGDPRNDSFQAWLAETCGGSSLGTQERLDRLAAWETAPHARYCHPREEHLLPLHVCAGAASGRSASCQELRVLGKRSLVAFWDSDR